MIKFKSLLLLLIFASVTICSFAQTGFGKAEKINNDWKFILQETEKEELKDLENKRWRTVELPHDWSVKQQLSPTLASATGYLPAGIGWYRKQLFVPKERENGKVYLYFEGVYNRSEVFVNGKSLGKRPNGYISFMYDATAAVSFGVENTITVKVDHSQSADSRWYTGSGIYRNVWVVYAGNVHIKQWGVYATSEKLKKGYQLNVEVEVNNETAIAAPLRITNELFSSDGNPVAKSSEKLTLNGNMTGKTLTALKVTNPQLWSLKTPSLYTLKTSVYRNGELMDATSTVTGFREFTFDPNKGFALNGEAMKIKGVCLHHDGGVLGSAVPREVWKRRLLTLKEIGVNAIRTSHNPQSPDLYQLCDELGLLVLDEAFDEWEFPKRKWLEGWNVGTPGFQGSFDFFEEWGEKDLADMVKRDRNHPSVFAWSIGNEVDYPNDPYSHPVLDGGGETGFTQPIFGGYKKDAPDAMRLGIIAERLAKVVKEFDKSRPVTAGLAGVAMSNQTGYPFALDIAGYNYTESLYDKDHLKYPNRVLFGSENRHDMDAWYAAKNKEFVMGQFLWTGIDYLGESGRWPSRGFYSGLLDFGGFIKPRGYFRQSLWAEKPMAYLGTYPTPGRGSRSQSNDVLSQHDAENEGSDFREKTPSMDAWPIWNYESGRLIRVVCYTNAAQAELKLNGKVVGEKKPYDEKTGIIYWDIPYVAGKLEVTGFDANNNEISRNALQSSGRPHAIKIISDENKVKSGEVAQVIIQVVDDQGVPVMLSDDEITCRIQGSGRLLGLEASNNSDMTDYTDNRHRVFHGRMIAYVKAGTKKGFFNVVFSANWLQPAEIQIEVQ